MAGPDSAQAVGPHTMLQGMTRIARWLARGTDSEGVVERAIRRSLIGKCIAGTRFMRACYTNFNHNALNNSH